MVNITGAGHFVRRSAAVAGVALLLFACAAMAVAAPAAAQSEDHTIKEEYTVTLNDVGDARIEDKLTYNDEDFDIMQQVVDENPTFLTRKYTSGKDIIEIENFDSELNDSENTVTLSFDSPGYAYNMGDYWVVYGFSEEPDRSGNEFTSEVEGYINSEFTLYTDMPIESKTVVKLPETAENAEYDSGETSIRYEIPFPGSELGFWSENRTLLTIIFAACAGVFALLLLLVLTRKTGPRKPSEAVVPSPSPGNAPTPPTEIAAGVPGATPGIEAAPAPPGPPEPVQKDAGTRACPECGHQVPAGKQFCTRCGARLED